jgi:hypothetical protein
VSKSALFVPRSRINAIVMVTTMTDRENAKLFQTSHWIPNPTVATNLVVVIFFKCFSGHFESP